MRLIAAAAGAFVAIASLGACSSAEQGQPSTSTSATQSSGAETSSPTPTATTGPVPAPLPPIEAGRARSEVIFIQRAEDASLVSGAKPIRLTLARTGNRADWFSSPAQRRTGTMSTTEALLALGWRPADDGTTSVLPTPRPNAMLASADGVLAFTIYRANVRADGTLVLDINPMPIDPVGVMPETVESYGPVTLTIDGVPGVLVVEAEVTDGVRARVIVTGNRNQQVVVQLIDAEGDIAESRFLARDRPSADDMGDVGSLSDVILEFVAPTLTQEGRVTLLAERDGVSIEQVLARWTRPEE